MKNNNISLQLNLLKSKVENALRNITEVNKELDEVLKTATEYNQTIFSDARKIKELEKKLESVKGT